MAHEHELNDCETCGAFLMSDETRFCEDCEPTPANRARFLKNDLAELAELAARFEVVLKKAADLAETMVQAGDDLTREVRDLETDRAIDKLDYLMNRGAYAPADRLLSEAGLPHNYK